MSSPSPRTAAPPYLPLDIKDSLKEIASLFALGLFAFWCGRLLEGKSIAEGELLKENC
jgi:hypothetical protein